VTLRLFRRSKKLVIPKLFEGKGGDDEVRVWVPGSSTGEEAYSIAILLREHLERSSSPPKVQVFATDIDETALSVARAARAIRQAWSKKSHPSGSAVFLFMKRELIV